MAVCLTTLASLARSATPYHESCNSAHTLLRFPSVPVDLLSLRPHFIQLCVTSVNEDSTSFDYTAQLPRP